MMFAGPARSQQASPAPDDEPHLIAEPPDGTPPPPLPPQPGFIAPVEDILSTQTFREGGRTITVHEIVPIDLPPPPTVVPAAAPSPAFQQKLAEFRARQPKVHTISIGATIYRDKDKAPRTLIQSWGSDIKGQFVTATFWSSADFSLLSCLPGFIDSDGRTCSLMMSWGVQDSQRMAAHGRLNTVPVIPEFPEGNATFLLATGSPDEATLADLQTLHDLYNNEHEKLQTAYQGREKARLAQEAELKAHPPKPPDLILDHWRVQPTSQEPPQEDAQ